MKLKRKNRRAGRLLRLLIVNKMIFTLVGCTLAITLASVGGVAPADNKGGTRTGMVAAATGRAPKSLPIFSSDDSKAIRAIVGEAAGEGRVGMLAVAGAIRNRGHLRGVYGVKNPMVEKQPAWVFDRARVAWATSATNDISRGATHWESKDFKVPTWAKSMTITTNIGKHVFYAKH